MSLTVRRPLPAFVALCVLLASRAPAYASGQTGPSPAAEAPPRFDGRSEFYSPRVRRSTVMYLRLRLLELREEGLDRARAAIEHRLSIDDLLAPPPRPAQPPGPAQCPQPPATRKAKGDVRPSGGP